MYVYIPAYTISNNIQALESLLSDSHSLSLSPRRLFDCCLSLSSPRQFPNGTATEYISLFF
jgi:hypothetical protein